jgi:hypothetical protein
MHVVPPARYEGTSSAMAIDFPRPGVVVLTIEGHDIGEFGPEPLRRLEKYLSDNQSIELYIDARRTKGVSVEVSSEWALWLGVNRAHFEHISMLTGSRFIQITAEFVRGFSDLQGVMRIYTEGGAFDEALASSVAGESGNR